MAVYQQPVIPEIAKAFENDPRTRIAQQTLAAGMNGAPTATGKWAWADGLARMFQGALGGYVQNKQLKKYGEDEKDLLALRAARGMEGQGGIAPPSGAPQMAAGAGVVPSMALPPLPSSPMAPPAAPQPPVAPLAAPATGAPLPGYAGGSYDMQGRPGRGVSLVHPFGGKGRVSGRFGDQRPNGRSHNGMDIAIDGGTPIGAIADGVVLKVWNDTKNGGGLSARVRHPDGSISGYAHLKGFNVKDGDTVKAGQPIGIVGSTGRSTGNHLHLTYKDANGKRINPANLKFGEMPAATLDGGQAAGPVNTPIRVPGVTTPEPQAEPMPVAPDAVPATASPRLRQSYRMMSDGNRYESAAAMDMMDRGLGEQGAFDEAAAARKADINNMGYSAGLSRYGADRQQRSGAAWDARRDERQQGFAVENREDTQNFQATEAGKDRQQQLSMQERNFAHDTERAGYDRQTSVMLAKLNNDADWQRTQASIEASRASAEDKAAAKRTAFFSTPTGAKIYDSVTQRISDNDAAQEQLKAFEQLNRVQKTGGLVVGNAPGVATWMNSNYQQMEAISQDMSIKLSGALKGAVSDKEGERILKAIPSIRNSNKANNAVIQRVRRALNRANDFETRKLEAMASGNQVNFAQEWNAYRNSVSIDKDTSFDEWKASLPSYDADGRRAR